MKRELPPAVIVAVVVVLIALIGGFYSYMTRPFSGLSSKQAAAIAQARKGPMPMQTSIPKFTGQ